MDNLKTLCVRIPEADFEKLGGFIVWGRVRKKSDVARIALAIGMKLMKRYGYARCFDAVHRYKLDESHFCMTIPE